MKKYETIRDYHKEGVTPGAAVLFWNQIFLSILYKAGIFRGTSVTKIRAKREMLQRIKKTLMDRDRCCYNYSQVERILELFNKHLEDPGMLKNAFFFCIDESDYMITFYLNLWDGKVGEVMEYLHGYGWNLKGEYGKIPKTDVWNIMIKYELMSIDAREKAINIIKAIKNLNPANAISLGCGQIVERHYGLLDLIGEKTELTLIDRNEPNLDECKDFNFIQSDLFVALRKYRSEDKDFVWMTGVWPYFSAQERYQLLVDVAKTLKKGGRFVFDQVIINPSLLRAAITQGWPRDPENPIKPVLTTGKAKRQVRRIVRDVNKELRQDCLQLKIEKIILVRGEKGYPTSVQFTLKKA